MCIGISETVGFRSIAVNRCHIFHPRLKEVEDYAAAVALLTCHIAHEPVAGALCLTGHGDVLARLSLKITALFPVDCHILDELEGLREAVIILRKVGSHLQR